MDGIRDGHGHVDGWLGGWMSGWMNGWIDGELTPLVYKSKAFSID